MQKNTILLALLCLVCTYAFSQAPNHLVISQVYGGGGGAGSHFKNDFVELYNPTATDVNLSGWSLQYSGSAGDNWGTTNKTDLSGTIKAGKYFLIALDQGKTGADLPTPDLSAPRIIMASTSGNVALVNNTTLLSGTCPKSAAIVDFVGFGSGKCFEGSDGTPTLTNILAAFRKNDGCQDTDDNKNDFFTQVPNPRNSQSPGQTCGISILVSGIMPQLFCVTPVAGTSGTVSYSSNTTLSGNLNVYLSDASGSFRNAVLIGSAPAAGKSGTINVTIPANMPSGTGYSIRVNATAPEAYGQPSTPVEIINGAKDVTDMLVTPEPTKITLHWTNPPGCYDEIMIVGKLGASVSGTPSGDGSAYTANPDFVGNGTSFDGGKVLYKGAQSGQAVTGLTEGQLYYFKFFTRRGIYWSTGTEISVKPRALPKPGDVVINQFNPGYSTLNANYEYIELVNNTGSSVDLSELAIRYQSPSTGNQSPAGGGLTGILPPHGYWLLTAYPSDGASETITVGKTKDLKRDGNITGGLGGASGQFALVRIADNLVLDAVRYGSVSAGTFSEGTPLATISNNSGYKRVKEGVDNNNNKADFVLVPVAETDLRNSQSRLANEGAKISGAALSRIYVTGNSAINGAITLSGKLVLQEGKLALGESNLTTNNIEGGNAASYVQTNGTGRLIMKVDATPVLFPVGHTTFNPVTLHSGGGKSWQARVSDGMQAGNAAAAVQRTWQVAPVDGSDGNATVSFHYNEGDKSQLGAQFELDEQVQVYQVVNVVWQKAGEPQEPGGTEGGMRTATLTGWSQFGAFVISTAGAQSALPIFFGEVKLVQRSNDIALYFTVHHEEGVDRYEVESSADGIHFERRAVLLPQSNGGTTVKYEFLDSRPLATDRFYRIRGVEQNGEVTFSAVVKAMGKVKSPALQVAPNPVVGSSLQYSISNLAAGNYRLRIINSVGLVVLQQSLMHGGGVAAGTISLPRPKSGWYVLELSGPQPMKQVFLVQ